MSKLFIKKMVVLFIMILLLSFSGSAIASDQEESTKLRLEADSLQSRGLLKEAKKIYLKLALDSKNTGKNAVLDADNVLKCTEEPEGTYEFFKQFVEVHMHDSIALVGISKIYFDVFINNNYFNAYDLYHKNMEKFYTSYHTEEYKMYLYGMKIFNTARKTLPKNKIENEQENTEIAKFYLIFADFILSSRTTWQLTELTNLAEHVEIDNIENDYFFVNNNTAPVDENGMPIFYYLPESFEQAKNDGERWRFLLNEVKVFAGNTNLAFKAEYKWAKFLKDKFGVQTLDARQDIDLNAISADTGVFAVKTLSDNETIARLANGIKRFNLPDEFNYIKIFKKISEDKDTYSDFIYKSLNQLGEIYANRMQYTKALKAWQVSLSKQENRKTPYKADYIDSHLSDALYLEKHDIYDVDIDEIEKKVESITAKVGMLLPFISNPGEKSKVFYIFKNGNEVELEARKIKKDKIVQDIKEIILNSDNKKYEEIFVIDDKDNKYAPSNDFKNLTYSPVYDKISLALIGKYANNYLEEKPIVWQEKLITPEDYQSQKIPIDLPISDSGMYLIKAKMIGGNTSHIIIDIPDLAIVSKETSSTEQYYVLDAETGKPFEGVQVDIFGYCQNNVGEQNKVVQKSKYTNKDGLVEWNKKELYAKENNYSWLVTAKNQDQNIACLGFLTEKFNVNSILSAEKTSIPEKNYRAFIITDRPAYKPDQEVNFTVYVANASYLNNSDSFAGIPISINVSDAMGSKIYDQEIILDSNNSLSGSFKLNKDALLGRYHFTAQSKDLLIGANIGFMVEEYKKPEFSVEVTAPESTIVLGDNIDVQVDANYYFGSPVTNGEVLYTVKRTEQNVIHYPLNKWDWLYGNGYWYTSNNESTVSNNRYISGRTSELIMQGKVILDDNGTAKFTIDTSSAKILHADKDQKYEISVQVKDDSRNTIYAKKDIYVTREPFKIFTWTDKNYYTSQDKIAVGFEAIEQESKILKLAATISLYKLTYDKQSQQQAEKLQSFIVEADSENYGEILLGILETGQYKIVVAMQDAKGNEITSAKVFTVYGDKNKQLDFKFNKLEVLTDKPTYQVGDTAKLIINTDLKNAYVVLFVRCEDSYVTNEPKIINITDKTAVVEIDIEEYDMPNFYCQVFMVDHGKCYTELKEIIVPPENKTINVEIKTDKKNYQPGDTAKVSVKLTDDKNKPLNANCVVSVYDKAIEYISGGSNIPDIKDVFWSWKRKAYILSHDSLYNFVYIKKKEDTDWQPIGVFALQFLDNLWGYNNVEASPMAAFSPIYLMDKSGANRFSKNLLGTMSSKSVQDNNNFEDFVVRKNFQDTALWLKKLQTNSKGIAEFEFKVPDDLTTWKINVWSWDKQVKVGYDAIMVNSTKDFIVRLQLPRFLVQNDQAIISANINNNLSVDEKTKVALELLGGTLVFNKGVGAEQDINILAKSQARADWIVNAIRPGNSEVRVKAIGQNASDAMQLNMPVLLHGSLKTENYSGILLKESEQKTIKFNVPDKRLPEQSKLVVQVTSLLVNNVLSAIPYLVEYPYSCTEQTLNRFLPLLMTKTYLKELGIKDINISIPTNNMPSEDKELAKRYNAYGEYSEHAGVIKEKDIENIVNDGVEKLASMQNPDGGWGWFSGKLEVSTPHNTAIVVYGLLKAKENKVALIPGMLEKGINWLINYRTLQIARITKKDNTNFKEYADNNDAFVQMVLSMAKEHNPDMQELLFRDRLKLSKYGLTLFALSLHYDNNKDFLQEVMGVIKQYVKTDAENQTAYLDLPKDYWWYWYNDDVEIMSWYLKLLVETKSDPEIAVGLAKYLVNNKKNATYWKSTRDTSYAIDALLEYAKNSGEINSDIEVKMYYKNEIVFDEKITSEDILNNKQFILNGVAVESGEGELLISKKGVGNLYYSAALTNFTLEDSISSTGLEMKVQRNYYKVVNKNIEQNVRSSSGQSVSQNAQKEEKIKLSADLDNKGFIAIETGDVIEVEMIIDLKNDYEYLIFEDYKPAGLEPLNLRSGYLNDGSGAYVEYKNEKIVTFIPYVKRGEKKVSYQLVAVTPGYFSALPVRGMGMYDPALAANSSEEKIAVQEKNVYIYQLQDQ